RSFASGRLIVGRTAVKRAQLEIHPGRKLLIQVGPDVLPVLSSDLEQYFLGPVVLEREVEVSAPSPLADRQIIGIEDSGSQDLALLVVVLGVGIVRDPVSLRHPVAGTVPHESDGARPVWIGFNLKGMRVGI